MNSPRFREPLREGQRVVWHLTEDLLPLEHPARMLWEIFGRVDLSAFARDVKSVQGRAGRRPYSPRMMLTLWGYAFNCRVHHAREIARRIETDVTFRWITGDIESINHSVLSDFLGQHAEAIDELMTGVLGELTKAGLIWKPTQLFAQDGMKVQANASKASFHTPENLAPLVEQARTHLDAQTHRPADDLTEGERRAQWLGATDVCTRLQQAAREARTMQAQRIERRSTHEALSPPHQHNRSAITLDELPQPKGRPRLQRATGHPR